MRSIDIRRIAVSPTVNNGAFFDTLLKSSFLIGHLTFCDFQKLQLLIDMAPPTFPHNFLENFFQKIDK